MSAPDATQPVGAGTVLSSRYRLVRLVAQGGMASVWEGYDKVLARSVAVKTLHPHLAEDRTFQERFRQESVSAARLAHPNVVATFDAGIAADGTAFIVMELIRGRTLSAFASEYRPLPIFVCVEIGMQIADALAHAHGAGLVHRDIKPANVLVCDTETDGVPLVKVTDFGIAKAAEGLGLELTKTGMILGTPKYLSPEQIDGRDPDARADLYALGVVLFELVAGLAPFRGPTEMAVAVQHLNETPARLRDLRPGVPPALDSLVASLLAKRPQDRPPSAIAVRQALSAIDTSGRQGWALGPRPPAAGSGPPAYGPRPPAVGTPPVYGPGPPAVGTPPVYGPGPPAVGAPPAYDPRPPVVGTGRTARVPRSPGPTERQTPTPPPPYDPSGPRVEAGHWPSGPAGPSSAALAATGVVPSASIRGGGGAGLPPPPRTVAPRGGQSRGRPRKRPNWAGRLVAALVVAALIVVVLVLVSHGSGSPNRPPASSDGSTCTTPVKIQGASVFHLERDADHSDTVSYAIDGNTDTSWETDVYHGPHFANLRNGLGLALTLGCTQALHTLSVTSATVGWSAEVYVVAAVPDPPSLASWGLPVASKQDIGGSTTFALQGRSGRAILLWITDLGPTFQASVAEVTAS